MVDWIYLTSQSLQFLFFMHMDMSLLARYDSLIRIPDDIMLTVNLQIKYSLQHILKFGLSGGEVVERVWSHLTRFAAMTKENTSVPLH